MFNFSAKKLRYRKWLVALALLFALAATAYLFRGDLLPLAASPLIATDNGHLRKADAIVVLGGGPHTRPFEAARLYKEGLAPIIVLANEEPLEVHRLGLDRSGLELTGEILTKVEAVTSKNIILLGTEGSKRLSALKNFDSGSSLSTDEQLERIGYVSSTREEAVALARWCAASGAESIIVITNTFHSRRAQRVLHKLLGTKVKVQVATLDNRSYTSHDWWQSEEGLIAFNNEWIKTVYYFFKY